MRKQSHNPFSLAEKLFPLNRSLASPDNLKSLKILKKYNKDFKIKFFKSGENILTGRSQWFGLSKMLLL